MWYGVETFREDVHRVVLSAGEFVGLPEKGRTLDGFLGCRLRDLAFSDSEVVDADRARSLLWKLLCAFLEAERDRAFQEGVGWEALRDRAYLDEKMEKFLDWLFTHLERA